MPGTLFKVSGYIYFGTDERHDMYDPHCFYTYLTNNGRHCKWEMKRVYNDALNDPKTDLQEFDKEFKEAPYEYDADFEYGKVLVGGIYRHFKGHKVEVIAIAQETEKPGSYNVIYKHIETGRVWSRPYGMFVSEVDKEKYPEAKDKYRFTFERMNYEEG